MVKLIFEFSGAIIRWISE